MRSVDSGNGAAGAAGSVLANLQPHLFCKPARTAPICLLAPRASISVRPKGCYAGGKRVEVQSASRVGACQAGPSARRAGRGWTHVRTGPRNTAIGPDWRVIHATLLANAHLNQAPRKGQAGMPDLRSVRQYA